MGIFDFLKKAAETVTNAVKIDSPFAAIVEAVYQELYKDNQTHYWNVKLNDSSVYRQQLAILPEKEKIAFILEAIRTSHELTAGKTYWGSDDKPFRLSGIWTGFLQQLLRSKPAADDEELATIAEAFMRWSASHYNDSVMHWPLAYYLSVVEKQVKGRKANNELVKALKKLQQRVTDTQHYDQKARTKIIGRINALLFENSNGSAATRPVWFPASDQFAAYANEAVKALPEKEQAAWFRLLAHVQKASGGSPSKKFLDEGKELYKEIGADAFKAMVNDWFRFITAMKESPDYGLIAAPNADMAKGLIWLCVHFYDSTTLFNLSAMAERVYRKIPGRGPAAPAIGNACLYTLAGSRGLEGVGHLSRLRLRIKQSSTQNLIEKYLDAAARKEGVSIHEIEDMAVESFDLQDGCRTYEFDGYKAVLSITGVGKTELNWYKPDGSPQKSVPAAVKEKYAAKLKKIKETIKQVELTTSAQRDRIDRLMKSERSLSWQQFNEYYLQHGLMSFIAKKLIWTFTEGTNKQAGIWLDGAWVNPSGNMSLTPGENTRVSLWHPVFHTVADIQQWRTFLLDRQLVQPLKQAFREVYLLTDAELHTRTYSNRMAAHILKQHQFNSLAKTRGWKYSLMGAYDNGIENDKASIDLPEYGLRAEFWLNEVASDDAFNDTGIWLYIATDQVRFLRTDTSEVKELIEVPALVFSEVMRDVDLFVGVASVGNDPLWRDNGGLVQYRDYWTSYSFGDLTEVAKTRKSMLERLLPRLRIAKVAEIRDKFLVVKGKLRTYKIHLGSTNILMEPNDQYLCIVADRSAKSSTEGVFLPFEGDNGLSVIISKALMLAEDDKISDTSITSQINRK